LCGGIKKPFEVAARRVFVYEVLFITQPTAQFAAVGVIFVIFFYAIARIKIIFARHFDRRVARRKNFENHLRRNVCFLPLQITAAVSLWTAKYNQRVGRNANIWTPLDGIPK